MTAAPAFQVSAWLNAAAPVSLAGLRGKVVAVYAFQMLCPGCVSHGIPQAKQIQNTFARHEVEGSISDFLRGYGLFLFVLT